MYGGKGVGGVGAVGGGLAATGVPILMAVALAMVLLFVGLLTLRAAKMRDSQPRR
jgi:hypothetical protein